MVGHILGLGDRHPQNIMMHRHTGELVHIDFCDCFEVRETNRLLHSFSRKKCARGNNVFGDVFASVLFLIHSSVVTSDSRLSFLSQQTLPH